MFVRWFCPELFRKFLCRRLSITDRDRQRLIGLPSTTRSKQVSYEWEWAGNKSRAFEIRQATTIRLTKNKATIMTEIFKTTSPIKQIMMNE